MLIIMSSKFIVTKGSTDKTMNMDIVLLSGNCPNCEKRLYFQKYKSTVECSNCGQQHLQSNLKSLQVASDVEVVEALLTTLESQTSKGKQYNFDKDKVNGLTNYTCSLLSPFLTLYGMEKSTGRAKLLTEMGKKPNFDCSQLCNRAFLIEPAHLPVNGFGRDRSGSEFYLKDTLEIIKKFNDNEERLVPIHADGDGHCLVHALSRALVGWQLFWHPLRINLKEHFLLNLEKYKMQFCDFIDNNEWKLIINECDQDYTEIEPGGLRNIHIFGLANVLKRPIILLDSVAGINNSGDYSGIFLPYFCLPESCKNAEGVLNPPLCIAWSSLGRNHFIPLVGIKGRKCPALPRQLIPRAWGVPDSSIDQYVSFDAQGLCKIGGEKTLQEQYLQRLVLAMADLFFLSYGVSVHLISDVYEQVCKSNGLMMGNNLQFLLKETKTCVNDRKLFICLKCWGLSIAPVFSQESCMKGGELYDLAVSAHKFLKEDKIYSFPLHGVTGRYNIAKDMLVLDRNVRNPSDCWICGGLHLREVNLNYQIKFKNGDTTRTKSNKCASGYKHYWDGLERDTKPVNFPVIMEWKGQVVKSVVYWFHNEEDPSNNSNVFEIAQNLVLKHFPGEFGSERLVQSVVNQILLQTEKLEPSSQTPLSKTLNDNLDSNMWQSNKISKAILTGNQTKSIHKEELNKSLTEKQVRESIEINAAKQQSKQSYSVKTQRNKPLLKTRGFSEDSSLGNYNVSKSQPSTSLTKESTSAPNLSQDYANLTTKKIRLSTSSGKNVTLEIPIDCTFSQLQNYIFKTTGVLPNKQKIRFGFPPRELKKSNDGTDYVVPIVRGDKVTLEIISPLQPEPVYKNPPTNLHGVTKTMDNSILSLASGQMDEISDKVLQSLIDSHTSGGDNIDHSIATLALTAALEKKEFWTYVQRMPHLFSVNGLFYKQVERDMGLEHGKHCQLPLLSHKMFVYNADDDRLEICLEPYGHFAIEPQVENITRSLLPTRKCTANLHHKPFSGQGHSLKSVSSQEDKMPTDVPMTHKRLEARRLNTFCDPSIHQESIEEAEEEPENEQIGQSHDSHWLNPSELTRKHTTTLPAPEARLVRKGPGYSELSPIPEQANNKEAYNLQNLVENMKFTLENNAKQMPSSIENFPNSFSFDNDTQSMENVNKNISFPSESALSLSSALFKNIKTIDNEEVTTISCTETDKVAALATEVTSGIMAMDSLQTCTEEEMDQSPPRQVNAESTVEEKAEINSKIEDP